MVLSENFVIDRGQVASRQLYDVLRAKILTAELRPGEALAEMRVAEQFGVSRTPVREVFRRLAEEGFLKIVPQVGTFVAPINLKVVYESQFVRETLECRAVALASDNATPALVRRLREQLRIQSRMISKSNHLGFFASDEAMHRALMDMAGHPMVWDMIASVKTQFDRVRHLSLESRDWLEMIYAEHCEIVAAVAAKDKSRAEELMRAHLRTAFSAIQRIARDHQEFFEGGATVPK